MRSNGHRIVATITAIIIIIVSYLTPLSTEYKWNDLAYCFFAFSMAYIFPDSDFYVGFLKHRSGVTHSALIPIGFFFLFPNLASGTFALTVATHLFADIGNPFKSLIGFGRIHIFRKMLSSRQSKWFFLLNGIGAVILGLTMIWIRF